MANSPKLSRIILAVVIVALAIAVVALAVRILRPDSSPAGLTLDVRSNQPNDVWLSNSYSTTADVREIELPGVVAGVSADQRIAIGVRTDSADGEPSTAVVYGSDLETGETAWESAIAVTDRMDVPGTVAVVGDRGLFQSKTDPHILAYDVPTGERTEFAADFPDARFAGVTNDADLILSSWYTSEGSPYEVARFSASGDEVWRTALPSELTVPTCHVVDASVACFVADTFDDAQAWVFLDAQSGEVTSRFPTGDHELPEILCDAIITSSQTDTAGQVAFDFAGNQISNDEYRSWAMRPFEEFREDWRGACTTLDSYAQLDATTVTVRDAVVAEDGRVVAYRDGESESDLSFTDSQETIEIGRDNLVSADGTVFANRDRDAITFFAPDGTSRRVQVAGLNASISNGILIVPGSNAADSPAPSYVLLPAG